MKNSKQANKSIITFFLLTFLLSVPFYILNMLAYWNVVGNPKMGALYIALFTITPITSALFLTFKRTGVHGLKKLLRRTFDYKRITKGRWYLVSFLMAPLFYMISLGVLLLFNISYPPSMTPLVAMPVMFIFFFLLAAGEELGWMGYAFEPMQSKIGTFRASLLLGIVWAFWHIPFFVFMMPDPLVFSTQILLLMGTRIIMTWIFNNTGRSVFAVILFHATDNTALVTLPEIHAITPLGVVVHCGIVLTAAILVTFLWGQMTLAQYRFDK